MAGPAPSSLPAARCPLPAFPSDLLRGLCVYQDIVLDGQTVAEGARDCQARWQALLPYLPRLGTALDVGSNFGWFARQLAQHAPRAVVASVEADERSAAVQRRVLASPAEHRVVLLTDPAGTRLAGRFAASGTRFDAVLCLAVLHWMRDHRQFLAAIGPIAGRIFIEQPDPREAGAGHEHVRREIGDVGDYLRGIFPDRTVRHLAALPSHRATPYPRQLWMVEEPAGWQPRPSRGLDAEALVDLGASWPPRSWWQSQVSSLAQSAAAANGKLLYTADGLTPVQGRTPAGSIEQFSRQLQNIPEQNLFVGRQRWSRRLRRLAGSLVRRLGVRR